VDRRREQAREAGEWLEFVVEHREHGVAGVTGLTEPSRRDRRAVTGTWLGRAFWGTGVNTEGKALLARLAFDGCAMERLGAYAGTANARSQRALEKAGFVREGTLRAFTATATGSTTSTSSGCCARTSRPGRWPRCRRR
jgi:ribosomal-protein-alanine N-acetyltransferase